MTALLETGRAKEFARLSAAEVAPIEQAFGAISRAQLAAGFTMRSGSACFVAAAHF